MLCKIRHEGKEKVKTIKRNIKILIGSDRKCFTLKFINGQW